MANAKPRDEKGKPMERRLSTLETSYEGLAGRLEKIETGQETLFTELRSISNQLAGQTANRGSVPTQIIFSVIAVSTPMIVAAAVLGHTFVRMSDGHLRGRIDEGKERRQKMRETASDARERAIRNEERIRYIEFATFENREL